MVWCSLPQLMFTVSDLCWPRVLSFSERLVDKVFVQYENYWKCLMTIICHAILAYLAHVSLTYIITLSELKFISHWYFYPLGFHNKGVFSLPASVSPSICPSICPWTSLCLHDKSSQMWTTITKFVPNMHTGVLSAAIENGGHWMWVNIQCMLLDIICIHFRKINMCNAASILRNLWYV